LEIQLIDVKVSKEIRYMIIQITTLVTP